jgi:hypothetical protein
MLFTQHVLLLVAALPLAYAQQTLLPPDDTCSAGTYRCDHNTLQTCNKNGDWETTKQCTKTAYCFAQDTINGGGDCHPLVGSNDKQCSTANEHRCDTNTNANTTTLQVCSDHGYWQTVKECSKYERCQVNHSTANSTGCITLIDNSKSQCMKHARRCHENVIQSCDVSGQWTDRLLCDDSQLCIDNCRRIGCKPYCMNLAQLFVIDSEEDASPQESQSIGFEKCTQVGAERCAHRPDRGQKCQAQWSGELGWVDTSLCKPLSSCIESDYQGNQTTSCVPSTSSVPTPIPQATYPPEPCTVGDYNCSSDFYTLLLCNATQKWQTNKKCTTPGDCKIDTPGQAHCELGGIDPPQLSQRNPTYPPEPCLIGTYNCSPDLTSLLICTPFRLWDTYKKCAAPATCTLDSPGKAHCTPSAIALPKHTRRNTTLCKTGDYTCATDLTTLAVCNAKQQWAVSKTCTNAGDCRIDGPGKAHCVVEPAKIVLSDLPWCEVGEYTCSSDGKRLLVCMMENVWKGVGAQCVCTVDGPGKAHCESGAVGARGVAAMEVDVNI